MLNYSDSKLKELLALYVSSQVFNLALAVQYLDSLSVGIVTHSEGSRNG